MIRCLAQHLPIVKQKQNKQIIEHKNSEIMKTLKQITLTLALIALTSSLSMAGSHRTFEMQLSNGKILEVVSKVEELLDEAIPGFEKFVRQFRTENLLTHANVNSKQEELIEEELPQTFDLNTCREFEYISALVAELRKEEELIEEDSFPRVEIARDNSAATRLIDIKAFASPEKEINEELPFATMITYSAR